MKVLYISYDGMTDPLGQSQVLPYLTKLSDDSTKIFLLSFEKKEKFEEQKTLIEQITTKAGIEWIPVSYTKRPPVLSTLWDLMKMKRIAFRLHHQHHFDIVHCRSYIAALVGLELKKKFGIRFIFDMRGFYADERVDGKLWNLKNPLYKTIYHYFKRKEKEFLEQADYTITLTYAAKEIIHGWHLSRQPVPIEVIPCCVDLELFNPENVDASVVKKILSECGLSGKEFILTYIGSLGTWYMPKEMLHFFKRFLLKIPEAIFLFVTHDDKNVVLIGAEKLGIPTEKMRFKKASREEVPGYIKASNVSIFFIKPVFSKKASSPTKQGEIMAMGVPIICNSMIGDTDRVVNKYNAGWVVKDFNEQEYDRVIDEMNKQPEREEIMKGASEFYSLEEGVRRYRKVYSTLMT